MNPAVSFCLALGQALAGMALYGPGHPARMRARDRAFAALEPVLGRRGPLRLSLLDGDVVVGARVLPELRGWDWAARLAAVGVERLEIDALPVPTADDLDVLLETLHARLQAGYAEPTPFAVRGIRAGPLAVLRAAAVEDEEEDESVAELLDALAQEPLDAEADAVRWIHDEVANARPVPMAEVEAVVHGLAAAMHRDQRVVIPLFQLKSVDQYTTTHSCNVAMLAMGLAEQVGLASEDVRAVGTAALLHDIGKVRVPLDVLVKPGRLDERELAEMRRHPVEGARILSGRGRGHALAATVAYEHHAWENGGGYPAFAYARRCHFASRLVHVCDLYDALRTDRPYRPAWTQARTLALLQEQAGIEVDRELVEPFVSLVTAVGEVRRPLADSSHDDWTASVARTAAAFEALPGAMVGAGNAGDAGDADASVSARAAPAPAAPHE